MRSTHRNRVLVIGAQGVLGGLVVRAFDDAGWRVHPAGRRSDTRPRFRYVNLAESATLAAALSDIDVVVNAVPDPDLTAELMVLGRGGILLNISAMPRAAGQRLREQAGHARGTVLLNAGIAPGITNLVAAELVTAHPQAEEVELAFTVSMNNGAGRAGREFAHRGLTTVPRHRTAVIDLPAPLGPRRCLGFAEPDRGWLGSFADELTVSPYLCFTEVMVQAGLLAANRTRLLKKIPRAAFIAGAGTPTEDGTAEPVAHRVAVLCQGEVLAAQTVECLGDYRGAAAATVAFATALARDGVAPPPGVFDPDELLSLREMTEPLADAGITMRQAVAS